MRATLIILSLLILLVIPISYSDSVTTNNITVASIDKIICSASPNVTGKSTTIYREDVYAKVTNEDTNKNQRFNLSTMNPPPSTMYSCENISHSYLNTSCFSYNYTENASQATAWNCSSVLINNSNYYYDWQIVNLHSLNSNKKAGTKKDLGTLLQKNETKFFKLIFDTLLGKIYKFNIIAIQENNSETDLDPIINSTTVLFDAQTDINRSTQFNISAVGQNVSLQKTLLYQATFETNESFATWYRNDSINLNLTNEPTKVVAGTWSLNMSSQIALLFSETYVNFTRQTSGVVTFDAYAHLGLNVYYGFTDTSKVSPSYFNRGAASYSRTVATVGWQNYRIQVNLSNSSGTTGDCSYWLNGTVQTEHFNCTTGGAIGGDGTEINASINSFALYLPGAGTAETQIENISIYIGNDSSSASSSLNKGTFSSNIFNLSGNVTQFRFNVTAVVNSTAAIEFDFGFANATDWFWKKNATNSTTFTSTNISAIYFQFNYTGITSNINSSPVLMGVQVDFLNSSPNQAPNINRTSIIQNYDIIVPNFSNSIGINSSADDPDGDVIMWVNFSLFSPNHTAINNINGTRIGSDWLSTNITIRVLGTWKYNASTLAGTTMTKTSTLTFLVSDNIAPQVNLTLANNSRIQNNTAINFTYNVTDNLDLPINCSLWINLSGEPLVPLINSSNVANNTISNFSLTISVGAPMSYNWTVNCTDTAGNINVAPQRFVNISNRIPTILNLTPMSGNFTDSVNITCNATTDIGNLLNYSFESYYSNDWHILNTSINNATNYFLWNTSLLGSIYDVDLRCNATNTYGTQTFNPSGTINILHNNTDNSNITNSTIDFYSNSSSCNITNSILNFSNCTSSTIRGSTINQSSITNASVQNSTINGINFTNGNISNDYFYSGTIIFQSQTFTTAQPLSYVYNWRSPTINENTPTSSNLLNNKTIRINITSDSTIAWVNLTINYSTNGSVEVFKLNRNGDIFNMTYIFLNGTYNLTAYGMDNETDNITLNWAFSVTDVIGHYPSSALKSVQQNKTENTTIEVSLWHDTNENLTYYLAWEIINATWFNFNLSPNNITYVASSNSSSSVKFNATVWALNNSIPEDTYSMNITIKRVNSRLPNKTITIPVIIGIHPPSGKPRWNNLTFTGCGNTNADTCYYSASTYKSTPLSTTYTINNSGYNNLTGCSIGLKTSANPNLFYSWVSSSSFTINETEKKNITITFGTWGTTGTFTGYLSINCTSSNAFGDPETSDSLNEPYVSITVSADPATPPGAGAGGAGGASLECYTDANCLSGKKCVLNKCTTPVSNVTIVCNNNNVCDANENLDNCFSDCAKYGLDSINPLCPNPKVICLWKMNWFQQILFITVVLGIIILAMTKGKVIGGVA